MAKTFLTSINLNQNELQNALAHPLSSDPGTPSESQFYYNSTSKTLFIYNGSGWIDIGGVVRTIAQSATPAVTIGGTASAVTIAISDADTTNSGLLSSAHWDLLNEATALATADTLVLRDVNGDFAVHDMTANKITGLADMSGLSADSVATKGYVDGIVSSSVTFKGGYNATTDTPVLDTDSTNIAIDIGDMYVVETAGTFFTVEVEVGDTLIAEVAMLANSVDPDETKWTIVNKNLDDASIKVAYENNLDTNEYNDASKVKVDFISVTQIVDLDAMETDIATNNAKVSNVTTDLSIGTTTDATVDVNSSDGTNATLPQAVAGVSAGVMSGTDKTKLDGIEAGADVTDTSNVDLAGAVMNSDTTTASMQFVVDEDNMASNLATKVPTQQSVKAYVDSVTGSGLGYYQLGVGNGSLTTISINHALGEQFCLVQLFKTLTPFNQVECDVNVVDANNLELIFTIAPTTNEYTVVITG